MDREKYPELGKAPKTKSKPKSDTREPKSKEKQPRKTKKAKSNKDEIVYPSQKDSGVVLGFDISSSVVGVCALDIQTGSLIDLWHYDFKDFDGDLLDKVIAFEKIHDTVMEQKQLKVVGIAVEDFAKKFSGGMSSIFTILTLARFNGMLCLSFVKKHGFKPHMLNVRSARASVGIKIDKESTVDPKDQIVQQVMAMIPEAKWEFNKISRGPRKGQEVLSQTNQDRADAYVIAKAYYNAISSASIQASKKR